MAKAAWKLVRDKIPAIIEAEGKTPETRIVTDKAYSKALTKKLDEEVKELKVELNSDNKYGVTLEICDVLEVLSCIANDRGLKLDELFEIANQKREERGSFLDGIELKIEK